MKKSLLITFYIAFTFSLVTTSLHAQMKIGTVDMNKIFNEYEKTKKAQKRLSEVEDQAKKELDERMESYKKVLEALKKIEQEATNEALSNEVKEEKRRSFQEKANEARTLEREINEFRQTRQKQIREQIMRMRRGLIGEIVTAITEKVKVEKYDLVFDRTGPSSSGYPLVVYARDVLDFTDPIIELINKDSTDDKEEANSEAPADAPAAE